MSEWLIGLTGGDTWKASVTLGVVGIVFALLAFSNWAADLILIFGVVLLLFLGILNPDQALEGLKNEGMVTVGVLFVVGAGIRETGAIDWIVQRILGRPKTSQGAVARMMFPTMALSAFINNTPLVAIMIPALNDWAKKIQIPSSKILLPLSYAAILGGTCTLWGTSTNFVVSGQLLKANGHAMGPFDITWVGVPVAIAGGLFIVLSSPWLLPNRRPALSQADDPREYTIEMLVPQDSPLANQTIEQAGLRHLPGVYLVEIDREGIVLAAVSPEERLRPGDRLVFVGIVDSVVDLQRMRGLAPATDQVFKLTAPRATRCLIEAVVSDACPIVGQTIRAGRFRSHYNAAVLAVARNGERMRKQKIGDIELRAGDTLLLESHPSFVEEQRNRRDFFLVSRIEGTSPPKHERAPMALAVFLLMMALAVLPAVGIFKASLVGAALMLAMRCVSPASARRSIEWPTLLAIAASLSLGKALELSGAAELIAGNIAALSGGSAWWALVCLYGVTLLATELVTNNAAAAIMFPFAMKTASTLDVNYMPFVIVVMIAASNGFATPFGYQTNLMVYGPGGYRFNDYLKMGIPLDLLVFTVAVIVTPLVFPF